MQKFFACILFLCCSLSVQAQLRLGPLFGAEVAKYNYAPSDTQAMYHPHLKAGGLGGLVVNYQVNERYSLQTEVLYLSRGRSVDYADSLLRIQNYSTLHFLEVPSLLRVSFPLKTSKQDMEIYFNAGPSVSYWLGGNGRLDSNRSAVLPTGKQMDYRLRFTDKRDTDKMNSSGYVIAPDRFVWFFQAGGGVLLNLGYGHSIMVDLRTSLGLGNSFLGDYVDFNSQKYRDNLAGNFRTLRFSVSYLKDFDVRAYFRKGKVRR